MVDYHDMMRMACAIHTAHIIPGPVFSRATEAWLSGGVVDRGARVRIWSHDIVATETVWSRGYGIGRGIDSGVYCASSRLLMAHGYHFMLLRMGKSPPGGISLLLA